jgi:hypothetical protein
MICGSTLGQIQNEVASVEAMSVLCPGAVQDVSCDELSPSYAAEVDEYMTRIGFVFVEEGPTQSLLDAAYAEVPLLDKIPLVDHGNVSTTVALDLHHTTQKFALTATLGAAAISFASPLPDKPSKVTLEIVQGGAGAFDIPASAWPAAAKFGSKGAPTFGDAAGETLFLVLDFRAGTDVYVHYDTNVF